MEPGARIDGYELSGEIARGAFGTVFRARDSAGREVALKLLSGRLDERSRERFLREGQITAALDDPGIVRVFGCGAFAGSPYLVYELVGGGRTLRDLFGQKEQAELVRLVRDAARALGHAHARGVVHRDIKPDNLLVDEAGRLRVADFGLALAEGNQRLTRTGELVGTPHYMAPEQIDPSRHTETPSTDVWALGVVLYEALTEAVPFDGANLVELGANVLEGKFQAPSGIRGEVSPALDAVCLRALQRDPGGRYADGAALAAALDAALAGRLPTGPAGPRTKSTLLLLATVACLVALAVWLTPRDDRVPPEHTGTGPAPSAKPIKAPLQRARAALAADQPQEAIRALGEAPGSAAARLIRAEAELGLGDSERVRATLAGLRSREAERLLAFADLLAGDLAAASGRLKRPEDLRALDLERQRIELDEVLVEAGGMGVGFDGLRCLARTRELAARARESLLPLGALSGDLRRRVMVTLTEAVLTCAVIMDRDDLIPELDTILMGLSDLRPDLSWGIDVARSWMWYFKGPRSEHPKVRELSRRDPGPYLDTIDPRLRGVALGMHYLTVPLERRRTLRSYALRALESRIPAGPVGVFRSELLAGLCIDQRSLAWQALQRGDPAKGRELLAPALEWAEELTLTRSNSSHWPSSQAVYTFLLAGQLDRARSYVKTMSLDNVLTRFLRAEVELTAGDPAAAYRELTVVELPIAEALVAKAHCLLLLGGERKAKEIDRLLAAARTSTERRAHVDWHAPGEFEHLRAGGWWPGKKKK